MDQYTQLLYGLASLAIAGFVSWTIYHITKVKGDIKDLELRIAKEYVKNEAVDEFRKDLKTLTAVVYEIAGKLNVPVRRE